MSAQVKLWRDEIDIDVGQTGCWRIGPLTLWARRLEHEWQLAHERDEHYAEKLAGWSFSAGDAPIAEDAGLRRFVFERTPGRIQARPALADRAIVVRPEKRFFVPGGQQASVYVSSPVWVSIQVGTTPVKLQAIAARRLSDTGFGPSSREGELCYASRSTDARPGHTGRPHLC